MSEASELETDPVFSPVGLLPHHDDHPFLRQMHRDAHTERHRNTQDYLKGNHSPSTNRKNAGILLRRMSDDFNVRKFPELLEGVKTRPRSQSEGSPLSSDAADNGTTSTKIYKLIRSLSSSAISPTSPANYNPPKNPTLLEMPNEEIEN